MNFHTTYKTNQAGSEKKRLTPLPEKPAVFINFQMWEDYRETFPTFFCEHHSSQM